MLQLRTRHFAHLQMATNCQWCLAIGYQVNRRKLTQNSFYVHNSLLTLDIVTVDTHVAIWECISNPCSMGRFIFNMEHYQQRICMTCLKINWMKVLFKPCLIYMLLVVATQLAVSKEKVL